MIFNSVVWKDELEKKVNDFKEYISNKSVIDDETFGMKVEEFFFVSAFIVRKLIEAFKLSDEYRSTQYRITMYLRNEDDNKIDFLNNHKLDLHYNFDSTQTITWGLNKICNLLIHSYIFMIAIEDEYLAGVFATTDYDKEKFVLFLSLDEYLKLLDGCINDNIVRMDYNRITGRLLQSSNHGDDDE